jgi:hypothetical protein
MMTNLLISLTYKNTHNKSTKAPITHQLILPPHEIENTNLGMMQHSMKRDFADYYRQEMEQRRTSILVEVLSKLSHSCCYNQSKKSGLVQRKSITMLHFTCNLM